MKRILLALTLLFSSQVIVAQVTNILVVVDTVHCGIVGDTDLTNYVTYDVFACFENEDDFLSAIYGELLTQDDPTVFEADEADIVVTDAEGCGCFNDPLFGAFLGNSVLPLTPEAEYDSYWTIGMESTFDAGNLDFISSVPLTGDVGDDPCAAMIDDGVIFSLNGSPNGIAGSDLKVQIGQFTTCSESISLQFCLQSFPLGVGEDLVEECFDDIELANPCLDNTLEITQPLLCFGDVAQISCEGLGNGEITFELFETDGTDTTLVSTQIDDPVFDNITEGDYFLGIIDSFGCKDTTNLISIVEPDELLVTLDMPEDNLCFGDAVADICPTIEGGTIPYTIEAIGPDSNVEEINLGECFENLGCVDGQGNYDIVITDDNGCIANADTVVYCPADLVITSEQTVIECFGEDDGELDISIIGGTGELTIDLDTPGFVQIIQEAPVDFEVLDIVPGTYTLTVVDENNCTASEEFVFDEPEEITVDYTATDIQCFGECSGTVTFLASGGTGDLTFTITDLDGVEADETALCAGDYEVIITDNNNCQVVDTVMITEPAQIQFTAATTDVTCFGANDGTICISDVVGGVGVVQWQIVSPPTQATELGTLPCFEMLPAETYVVNLVDEVGCTIPINGLEIIEPDEILIDLEVTNVSCNDFGDGEIVVTTSGGTGDVTTISPASLIDLIPGDYNVIVMDESGCQDSVLTSITEPDVLTIEVLSTTVIGCGGDCDGTANIELEGGTGELVLFLNDVASVPFGLCSGDYEAIVLDENLCTDTAQFEIIQPDPIEFIIDVENVTCTGMNDGEVTIVPIGGTGPLNFEILEDVDIFNLFEGEYTVLAEDSTGCFADSTFTIGADITTDLDVTLFTSPVTCWEEADGTATAAVTGGELPISYQWNDENEQTTATAVGLPEEVYSVTVTDAIGCTLSFLIEVEPTVGCFFIADALTPNGDGANDEWVIGGLEYFPNSTVQVFNRWGQLLFESTGYATRWDGRFKSNLLPIADYYYVITYDETKDPITGTVTIKY